MSRRVLLGIDAGGSQTRIHTYAEGHLLHEELTEAANPLVVGTELSVARIRAGIERAIAKSQTRVAAIGLAVAGVGARAEHQVPGRDLLFALKARFQDTPMALWNDAEAALAAAFEGRRGILLLCGTGMAVLGHDGHGRLQRGGGWGRGLGDPGSAYSLFYNTARCLLAAHDGKREAVASLDGILLSRLQLESPQALIRVFANGPSAEQIKSAVDAVHEAASVGDADAKRMLRTVGRELLSSLLALRDRMPREESYAVVASGGLLEREGPIRAFLADSLREGIPGLECKLSSPLHCASAAAAMLAAERFAIEEHGLSSLLSALEGGP